MEEMLSVIEFAKRSGWTRQYIYKKIKDGTISAEYVVPEIDDKGKERTMISVAALEFICKQSDNVPVNDSSEVTVNDTELVERQQSEIENLQKKLDDALAANLELSQTIRELNQTIRELSMSQQELIRGSFMLLKEGQPPRDGETIREEVEPEPARKPWWKFWG